MPDSTYRHWLLSLISTEYVPAGIPAIVEFNPESLNPLDQTNVKGGVPPVGVTEIEPVLWPLQITFAVISPETGTETGNWGSVIVAGTTYPPDPA